jgi:murein DD-endopeptidase MepM/ murein hydrolase activator NlpD
VEIDVLLDVLEPPIGAVWILHVYGPISGRYLLTKVRGSYQQPKATVTLTSPQPILPEPASTTSTRSRVTAQSGDAVKVAGRDLVYPTAIHGTDLGGVKEHMARAFGNWQSDNAVDIGVPIGTEVFAVDDGIIVRLGGAYDGTGQSNPNGYNITLKTHDNQWFYTHLSQRRALKIGQRVDRGMSFGRTGAANGVAHLHIGSEKGDPEALLGVDRLKTAPTGTAPAPQTARPNF